MEWKYWIEEVLPANEPGMIREQLDHIGLRGWEAVTSWPLRTALFRSCSSSPSELGLRRTGRFMSGYAFRHTVACHHDRNPPIFRLKSSSNRKLFCYSPSAHRCRSLTP